MRSGSTYLEHLLNSHNKIICDNEIFNPGAVHIKKHGVFSKNHYQLRKTEPIEYLELFFSQNLSQEASHLGFRLFYDHAQKKNEAIIWNYLQDMGELTVIHLKRLNFLNNLLSWKLAQYHSKWMRINDEPKIEYEPIYLEEKECLEFFEMRRREFCKYDDFFAKNKLINIYYEGIVKDMNHETHKILLHLGLEGHQLSSPTKKQVLQKTSELIANYSELKDRFVNTPWEEFFDD